jgi:hypothetical protein
VQKVVYDDFDVNIIRLRVSVPVSAGSQEASSHPKYLTRMKESDFFQILTMYTVPRTRINDRIDCVFPFASEKEKETERHYIEKHYPVVRDPREKIRGLWVTGDDALSLAKEYGIEEYILAMQEASPGKPNDQLYQIHGNSNTNDNPFLTPKLDPEVPRRSRRSASPRKAKTTKPPTTKGRKKKGSVVDDESVKSTSPIPHDITVKAEEALEKVKEESVPFLDSIIVGVPLSSTLMYRKMTRQSY